MAGNDRDLFRAIVLSGVALVSLAPGCGTPTPANDAAPTNDAASGNDANVLVADAGHDANDLDLADAAHPDTGMPAIL